MLMQYYSAVLQLLLLLHHSCTVVHCRQAADPNITQRSAAQEAGDHRDVPRSQKELLENLLKGYDVNEWPHFYYGKRTDVHVQMFINSFGSLNAASMDFRIDLFLRQTWQDPRLAYSDRRPHLTVLDPQMQARFWRPDTYFDNVKEAKIHQVTVPNVLLRLSKMGDVLYSMRFTLLLSCHMQFEDFPHDTQECYATLASFSSTKDMLVYHWHSEQPINIPDELEIAEFDMMGNTTSETTMSFSTGNFSGLLARFTLRRQNGYHVLQTYVPTVLIVSISWVNFWLDPNAVPGRVTLGVTTLLTLTTLASGIRQSLPPVSYVKAIDVWVGMCMIMVFGALIEFTIANWLANKTKYNANSSWYISDAGPNTSDTDRNLPDSGNKIPDGDCKTSDTNPKLSDNMEDGDPPTAVEDDDVIGWGGIGANPPPVSYTPAATGAGTLPQKKKRTYLSEARTLDRASRVLFPATFLLFNLFYWTFYLLVQYGEDGPSPYLGP